MSLTENFGYGTIEKICFFILTNVLAIATISITLNFILPLFGVVIDPQSYMGLLIFCSFWGMGGAFISLFLSKWMAKRMMGVKIIDPLTSEPQAAKLIQTVHNLARQARLEKIPEVGFYDSPEVNAFATGPSSKNSLVAVSSGLLQRMNSDQVEGVLAHEIAHIANGDMVTMTLIQGVVNAFAMFLARIAARLIMSQISRDGERGSPFLYFGIVIALDILFSLLGSIIVCYFSRLREYRADMGGAKYAGKQKMISALQALSGTEDSVDNENKAFASMKISGKRGSFIALFMTHPPLEDRIKKLDRAPV